MAGEGQRELERTRSKIEAEGAAAVWPEPVAPSPPSAPSTGPADRVIPGSRSPNRERVVSPDEPDDEDFYFRERKLPGTKPAGMAQMRTEPERAESEVLIPTVLSAAVRIRWIGADSRGWHWRWNCREFVYNTDWPRRPSTRVRSHSPAPRRINRREFSDGVRFTAPGGATSCRERAGRSRRPTPFST